MAKLDASCVVTAPEYRRVRGYYRRIVSAARACRRIRLGDVGSLQFENLEFAVWHVHELLHAEGWSHARIERTIEDAQPWVAGAEEVVATLMLDSTDAAQAQAIGRMLTQPGAVVLRAGCDALPSDVVEAGTASDPVWYLRWRVTPWWHTTLSSASVGAHLAWDPEPVTLPAVTTAALRTDLVEARGRSVSSLHRLLERTQHDVQLQSPRHAACS